LLTVTVLSFDARKPGVVGPNRQESARARKAWSTRSRVAAAQH